MSYCRFGWDGSDFYIYGSTVDTPEGRAAAIICHGPGLETVHVFKGREQDLIDYLHNKQDEGLTVPQAALDRLEAERDGREYRTTVEETMDEIARNPQMFNRSVGELADALGREAPNTDVTKPFVCPRCKKTSWHPEDARQGYCGACHAFTGTPTT